MNESISIAVIRLHFLANSYVKWPLPEPISKMLSFSFKRI